MKKTTFVALLAAFSSSTAIARADLTTNGQFEQVTDGQLAGWNLGEKPFPTGVPVSGISAPSGVTISRAPDPENPANSVLRLQAPSVPRNTFGFVFQRGLRLLPGFRYQMALRYRASGLVSYPANAGRGSRLVVDVLMSDSTGKVLTNGRIQTLNSAPGWTKATANFMVPAGVQGAELRVSLVNSNPNNPVEVLCDDLTLEPMDAALPNPGFEASEADAPLGWMPYGPAKMARVAGVAHSGTASVSVSDAPQGMVSGWSTQLPVRPDRSYRFAGYVRGGNLNSNAQLNGGLLSLQYLDNQGQPVGTPALSPAVGANTDWTQVATPKTTPPPGAVVARLTAGLQFTTGTAWFDDLSLDVSEVALLQVAHVRRTPLPAPGVQYAVNLLPNGDIESGEGTVPSSWSYIGRSAPDWTPAELDRYHAGGRPEFGMGRGQGEWCHDITYAGRGALQDISIDPPLTHKIQWYGGNPVDGYWLSAPMPVRSGQAYLTGGWIRPGQRIANASIGPLQILFYDSANRSIAVPDVRPAIRPLEAGVWNYYVTVPYVAPAGAVTMRLRFGHELKADEGGWGRSYADNLAVWALPADVKLPAAIGQILPADFRSWFQDATAALKPPYCPSPADAIAYTSVWGQLEKSAPGNLFYDPAKPVKLNVRLANLLGESRQVTLDIRRYDWLGEAANPVTVSTVALGGASDAAVAFTLSPTGKFGTYYVEVNVREGEATVGQFAGRYAVLPPLNRPRTAENIWAVTPLVEVHGDGRPYEIELGRMLKVAGFGTAFSRVYDYPLDEPGLIAKLDPLKRVGDFYHSLGMRNVLQLFPKVQRPVEAGAYRSAGTIIGREMRGHVDAFGNWGIEMANSASPFRGAGAARTTDAEYDTILGAQYDGIKSAADVPVLIGNIATDVEGKTIRRLYGKPANGKFDGAILNAYNGLINVCQTAAQQFDAHGDTRKKIWQEENADQRSPVSGEARRYGEADGPKNMVRTWLGLVGRLPGRLATVTMWGFNTSADDDIQMVTSDLQPRPQYAAFAVMTNALADATFVADRSENDTSIFEWRRGDGTFLALWANAGERHLTFEVPAGKLTRMDLMGNLTDIPVKNGLATLKVDTMPIYLSGPTGLAISRRLEARLENASTRAGEPKLRLTMRNRAQAEMAGTIFFPGSPGTAPRRFQLAAGQSESVLVPVSADGLESGKRTPFTAELHTDTGAEFVASAALNFAAAVRAKMPPSLDGTWKDWSAAIPIQIGEPFQVVAPQVSGESYDGKDDISGKMRLLWDDDFLYLGLEANDDRFVSNPERGRSGFLGDSIEFAVQPENKLDPSSPFYEYELYLPADGDPRYAASRRRPAPGADVTTWRATVKPTGVRGNVNYQAAIPWADLGLRNPGVGRTFSLALVLNDIDDPGHLSPMRARVRWFDGVDMTKNPQGFGDVTLVEAGP